VSVEFENISYLREYGFKSMDCIIAVYDQSRPDTLKCLHDKWLPYLRKENYENPVIVVGTKSDLSGRLKEDERISMTKMGELIIEHFEFVPAIIK